MLRNLVDVTQSKQGFVVVGRLKQTFVGMSNGSRKRC